GQPGDDGLRLSGELGPFALSARQADEYLVLLRVVVRLDHGSPRGLVDDGADAVDLRGVREPEDELRPALELDAVADAVEAHVGQAAEREEDAQGNEDLRLAEKIVMRVLQDLHGGPRCSGWRPGAGPGPTRRGSG